MPTVRLRVRGVQAGEGSLVAGLYREPDFKRFGGGDPVARGRAAPTGPEVVLTIDEVRPGVYAAAAYHDENDVEVPVWLRYPRR